MTASPLGLNENDLYYFGSEFLPICSLQRPQVIGFKLSNEYQNVIVFLSLVLSFSKILLQVSSSYVSLKMHKKRHMHSNTTGRM